MPVEVVREPSPLSLREYPIDNINLAPTRFAAACDGRCESISGLLFSLLPHGYICSGSLASLTSMQ